MGSVPVEVGDHLLVELVHRFDRKLPIRECIAEAWPEAEHCPGDLMAGHQDVRKLAGRNRPCLHRVDRRAIKTGSRARRLVRQVHGPILPDEILVPTHSPVGRGFPGLAAETASVDHDDGSALIAATRNLILHVHLVHRHLAAGSCDALSRRWIERLRFSADEKASLLCDHERFLEIVPEFRVWTLVLAEDG